MKFFLTSIRRVTSLNPQRIYVTIASNNLDGGENVDVSAEIEVIGDEFMNKTLEDLEKIAIDKILKLSKN